MPIHPAGDTSTIDVSFSALSSHGNHWKHLDDDTYLPPYYETDKTAIDPSRSIEVDVRIHDRRAFDDVASPLFDQVEFTLHGAVRTHIGEHEATQKILQVTEQRNPSDFTTCVNSHEPEERRRTSTFCTTVTFDTSGVRLPTSTTITGSKYVTEHTALSDQRLVTGSCEVQFWITTQFTTVPSAECASSTPRGFSRALELSLSPSSIHVSPSSAAARIPPRLRFKENWNSIFAYCGYNRHLSGQPTATNIGFNIPLTAPLQLSGCGTSDNLTFTLPVTMTITIPTLVSAAGATKSTLLRHHLRQKGLESIVSLSAYWHEDQRFSAGALAKDYTIMNKTSQMIAKDTKLDFPPFYTLDEEHGEEYTATTYVDLVVPRTLASSCSFGSELLRISHSISLVLSTKKLEVASFSLLPSYMAKMQADVSLS